MHPADAHSVEYILPLLLAGTSVKTRVPTTPEPGDPLESPSQNRCIGGRFHNEDIGIPTIPQAARMWFAL
jgi:hypothetical protein